MKAGEITTLALEYYGQGWNVIDLDYKTKKPSKEKWTELEYTKDELTQIFSNGPKNIGVRLGSASHNLVDVDVDDPYALKIIKYLPYTGMVFGRESNPRSHYLYQITDEIVDTTKKFVFDKKSIIELRSNGGQSMFPPSIHPDGETVQWYEYEKASQSSFANLYQKLAQIASATLLGKFWPNGARHSAIGALSGGLARSGWNEQDISFFVRMILMVADDNEVEDRLRYVHDTYEAYTQNNKNITGFKTLAEYINADVVDRIIQWLKLVEDPIGHNWTTAGNARRIIDKHGTEFFFHIDMEKFFVWNGQYWEEDRYAKMDNIAIETLASVLQETKNLSPEQYKQLYKFTQKSEDRRKRKDVIGDVGDFGTRLKNAELDQNPYLFNVINGTTDTRVGELYPPKKSDYITKVSPVVFDSNATCPIFMEFLNKIFAEDQDLIQYVQTAIGYSMTGLSTEKTMFICLGDTDTGKTTLLNAILEIMGDYGTEISEDVISKNPKVDTRSEIAQLDGKRFSLVSEPTSGVRLNDAKLKAMTGRSLMTGRFLWKESFTFMPVHKLWIDTNFRPVTSSIDDAIQKRIKIIEFRVQIPEHKQDHQLHDKLRKEYSGILNWMLAGAVRFYENGLVVPEIVTKSTNQYRESMDVVGRYIKETYDITYSDNDMVPVSIVRDNYKLWSEEEGIYEITSSGERNRFNAELTKFGLKQSTKWYAPLKKTTKVWIGIRTKDIEA